MDVVPINVMKNFTVFFSLQIWQIYNYYHLQINFKSNSMGSNRV